MSFDLFDKKAFLNAVTPAEKPIAFLVGSPLSWDSSGGVAGVSDMCKFIRDKVQSRKRKALSSFEQTIEGKSGADLYQTALRWLHANVSQAAVNEVIREAVRGARQPSASKVFGEDGDPEDWHLPTGTAQLAELVCTYPEDFPGPLLTTNFDPLLSLAIRETGGIAHRRIVDSDGDIGRDAESDPGTHVVTHLHGYWRASDTLHTPTQLTAARPKLKASLQSILRKKTLVVVAYSGWDDVFTTALADILHDNEAELDVLWCFRESDSALVTAHYTRLIEKMQPAIARGVFRAYGGIDCHSIFSEIKAELTPTPTLTNSAQVLLESPLPGWECLDAAALSALEPLKEIEARRYYDGAVPGWRHALSKLVPRREAVKQITKRRSKLEGDSASLQLIRAAGGEGKTTILLQVAVEAAQQPDLRILWRSSRKLGLSPEQLINLSPQFQWLIVADDAENLITSIAEAALILAQNKRANVDFLLAARDSDWRAKGGDKQPWAQWLQYQEDIVLRGISRSDAIDIVTAWTKAGALRELAKENDATRRPDLLLKAVEDQTQSKRSRQGDGSFFGGLLAVRFSEAGLRAHVREFLAQLRAIPIYVNDQSLADALLYVAACHGAGIAGLDEKVLADLLDVPRDWVSSRVVRPLGEEAAAVSGGGRVFTRHSHVAAAVLLEAEVALDIDLSEIWAQIVKQTVAVQRETTVSVFSSIVHAGAKLQASLPPQMPLDRRKAIAIAAGIAAANAKSEWLGTVVNLGKTYREAGELPNAVELFRRELSKAPAKVDFQTIIRGYWYEWGMCEMRQGQENGGYHDTWLQGLSLSDYLDPAPLTIDQVTRSCSGLGVALGKLATNSTNSPFSRAFRSIIDIGRRMRLDERATAYFDRYEKTAEKLGIANPKDLDESIAWLTDGITAAGAGITDEELIRITMPRKVSFNSLRAMLKRYVC